MIDADYVKILISVSNRKQFEMRYAFDRNSGVDKTNQSSRDADEVCSATVRSTRIAGDIGTKASAYDENRLHNTISAFNTRRATWG